MARSGAMLFLTLTLTTLNYTALAQHCELIKDTKLEAFFSYRNTSCHSTCLDSNLCNVKVSIDMCTCKKIKTVSSAFIQFSKPGKLWKHIETVKDDNWAPKLKPEKLCSQGCGDFCDSHEIGAEIHQNMAREVYDCGLPWLVKDEL